MIEGDLEKLLVQISDQSLKISSMIPKVEEMTDKQLSSLLVGFTYPAVVLKDLPGLS